MSRPSRPPAQQWRAVLAVTQNQLQTPEARARPGALRAVHPLLLREGAPAVARGRIDTMSTGPRVQIFCPELDRWQHENEVCARGPGMRGCTRDAVRGGATGRGGCSPACDAVCAAGTMRSVCDAGRWQARGGGGRETSMLGLDWDMCCRTASYRPLARTDVCRALCRVLRGPVQVLAVSADVAFNHCRRTDAACAARTLANRLFAARHTCVVPPTAVHSAAPAPCSALPSSSSRMSHAMPKQNLGRSARLGR